MIMIMDYFCLRQVDWAMGEAMAFGSLLKEGTHVRLSGGSRDCPDSIIMLRFLIQVRMSREEPSPIVTMSSTTR